MGIFSLTQELAIDLGTANTLIIYNGKVVVDEPSIVALDVHTGKLVAIGHQARQMHEKTNPNIKTIRPLKDGVIADFNATELMLRGMIKKVKTSGSLFAPSLRMVICIPSGSTNVEIRAVRDSAEHAGGREVYMIYEPMAAALGAGLAEMQDIIGSFADALARGDREGLTALLAEAAEARRALPAAWVPSTERLLEVRIPMEDRPGVVAEVTTHASSAGCNIQSIEIDHVTEDSAVLSLVLTDEGDVGQLSSRLIDAGFSVSFSPLTPKEHVHVA